MPRLSLFVAAVLVLVCAGSTARAQIVNVQPLVSKADDAGFSGEVGGSLTYQTGSVELFLVNAKALMFYRKGVHTLISSSSADLGFQDEDRFSERLFSHLRWQAILNQWLTWETYAQVATDRFRRLTFRGLAGAGPRVELLTGPAVSAAFAVSYMFEREALNHETYDEDHPRADEAVDDSGDVDHNHRISTYLTAKFVIDPLVSFIHTTYYQPLLTDFAGDYRVSSDTSLAVKVAEAMSIAITFNVAFDSDAPEKVKPVDTSTRVSLNVGF